jgi:hypothetical protein
LIFYEGSDASEIFVLWHIEPLLGNDLGISKYVTDPRCDISQKTTFFIVAAVRTSNLTSEDVGRNV